MKKTNSVSILEYLIVFILVFGSIIALTTVVKGQEIPKIVYTKKFEQWTVHGRHITNGSSCTVTEDNTFQYEILIDEKGIFKGTNLKFRHNDWKLQTGLIDQEGTIEFKDIYGNIQGDIILYDVINTQIATLQIVDSGGFLLNIKRFDAIAFGPIGKNYNVQHVRVKLDTNFFNAIDNLTKCLEASDSHKR